MTTRMQFDAQGNEVSTAPGSTQDDANPFGHTYAKPGVHRVTIQGDQISSSYHGVTQGSSGDPLPAGGAGLLDTAHDPASAQLSGPINSKSRVNYQGYEIDVRTAVNLGLLRANADGSYSEVGASAPVAPQVAPQGPQGPSQLRPWDPAAIPAGTLYERLAGHLGQGVADQLMSDLSDDFDLTKVEHWHNVTGIPKDQVVRMVEGVAGEMKAAAHEAMSRAGIEQPEVILNEMLRDRKAEVLGGIRELAYLGSDEALVKRALRYADHKQRGLVGAPHAPATSRW